MAERKVKSDSKGVKIHNTVTIDTNEPVPGLNGGTVFTTINGSNYHPFLGNNDTLFRKLLELRLLSPTQNNCLNDKVFYSIGDGLQVLDKEFPTEFDKKINPNRQTIDDVTRKTFDGFYQDGNYFIEIACTEIDGERFVHAYPHNNMDCRLKEEKDGAEPKEVLRSRMFRQDGLFNFNEKDKPITIPLWKGETIKDGGGWVKKGNTYRTMIHIKNEFHGIDFYGLPSNFPGNENVSTEHSITTLNKDNLDNNMFAGGALFIEGNVSPTEEKKLVQQVKKMHVGKGKGGRILVISTEGGITGTKFVPFTEKYEGHFIELDKHNEDKIINANGWSRTLLDMQEGSSLGKGGEFLKQLFQRKFRTVISPAQQVVLNNFIFPLMLIHDEWKGTKFYDLPWIIKPVIPVSLEGILDINSLLTVDEGRAEIGKKPIEGENGKKMISEIGAKPKEEKPKEKGGEK